MQRENFGRICSSLRKDIFNPAAGRAWSQSDLAEKTDLPVRLIGQIERGEKARLEEDTLSRLAEAFSLTTAERGRFFALASTVSRDNLPRESQTIGNLLDKTLEEIQTLCQPVLLHDGLYRIIGLNSAYRDVYGLTNSYLQSIPDEEPTKYHIVRHIHDPISPVRAVYKSQVAAVELNNAVYWRYLSLAHRYDDLFDTIQAQLLNKFSTFSHLWNGLDYRLSERDKQSSLRSFQCRHPHLGTLQYMVNSTRLYAGERELFMTLLVPGDRPTLAVFNELISSHEFSFTCFDQVANDLTC